MNIMYARFEPEPLFERMIRIHRMFHRKWMPMQFCHNCKRLAYDLGLTCGPHPDSNVKESHP